MNVVRLFVKVKDYPPAIETNLIYSTIVISDENQHRKLPEAQATLHLMSSLKKIFEFRIKFYAS
jgi:hypothetical protein